MARGKLLPILFILIVLFLLATSHSFTERLHQYNPNPHPYRLPEKIHVWDYDADPPVERAFLDYEEYVKGVVPSEWIPSWGTDALWTGAVACRTYGGNSENWKDLDPDGSPQIWDSTVAQVWEPANRTPRTDQIVDNTAGVFIIYNSTGDGTGAYMINHNNVINAMYSKKNGPVTTPVPGYPYLQSISDPIHPSEPIDGHGKGVCQYGTQDWDSQYGWKWSQILHHYYTYIQFQQQDGVVGYYHDDHDDQGNCLHPDNYFYNYVTARADNPINFNWGEGSWDETGQILDCFSILWQGNIEVEEAWYTFYVTVDDGARLWVDDHLIIDEWHDQATTTYAGAIKLDPDGSTVPIKLEYYEEAGEATARLSWLRGQGLTGYYFSNQDTLDPTLPEDNADLEQIDVPVWLSWPTVNGVETSPKLTYPDPLISTDNFLAKWKGNIWIEENPDPDNIATLFILLTYESEDQVLVQVDGQDLSPLNTTIIEGTTHLLVSADVTENEAHLLEVWMLETTGPAQMHLLWWDPDSLDHEVFLPVASKNVSRAGQGDPSPTPVPPPPTPTPDGGYIPPPTPQPTLLPPPPDTEAPVSEMNPLPSCQANSSFLVSWSGSDTGGSGLASYDVEVRVGKEWGGTWTTWRPHTKLTADVFVPVYDGVTYEFRCRARDRAGNVEAWPLEPDYDTFTTVDLTPPSSKVEDLPPYSGETFEVSWTGWDTTSGISDYDAQYCLDDCEDPVIGWTGWLTRTTATSTTSSGAHGHTYYFRSRARDNAGNLEDWPADPDYDTFTTIDTQPPSTTVEAMNLYTTSTTFLVRWHGSDGLSGLDHYDVYYRDESEAFWQSWLQGITTTQASFTGTAGHTYHFCSRGVDRVGNTESQCPPISIGGEWPIQGDAQIGVQPWSRVDPLPIYSAQTRFTVSWVGSPGVQTYDVQVRDGRFGLWLPWLNQTSKTSARFNGQYGHIYYFRCRGNDSAVQEVYPYDYDTYTKVESPEAGGGPLAPPGGISTMPPDEAPDRMEEVTRTYSIGVPLLGYIAPDGDVDWYRLELTETMRLRATLYNLPADYDVYVFDGEGVFLWASTRGYERYERVVAQIPAGTYYVRLDGYAGAWSQDASYYLLVEEVE